MYQMYVFAFTYFKLNKRRKKRNSNDWWTNSLFAVDKTITSENRSIINASWKKIVFAIATSISSSFSLYFLFPKEVEKVGKNQPYDKWMRFIWYWKWKRKSNAKYFVFLKMMYCWAPPRTTKHILISSISNAESIEWEQLNSGSID